MPEFIVTETKETSTVDGALSLSGAKDEAGRDYLLLTLHFESNIAVRLPLTIDAAMRIWALLDRARADRGLSVPSTPVSAEKLQ